MKKCSKCGKENLIENRYCHEANCREPLPILDAFTQAYINCALWASTNEYNSQPLDRDYDANDLSPSTLEAIKEDCKDFQESFGQFFEEREEQAGHDFFLTRNHHGAGFWDGDWEDPILNSAKTVGRFLTIMSHPYGSFNLYVGDDDLIYHHN